jgi:hypothetical protein
MAEYFLLAVKLVLRDQEICFTGSLTSSRASPPLQIDVLDFRRDNISKRSLESRTYFKVSNRWIRGGHHRSYLSGCWYLSGH